MTPDEAATELARETQALGLYDRTPVARLRAAAQLVRDHLAELAEHAGTELEGWASDKGGVYTAGFLILDSPISHQNLRYAVAAWAALVGPDIAEPLARVFESTADSLDRFECGHDPLCLLSARDRAVINLADRLLRGTP